MDRITGFDSRDRDGAKRANQRINNAAPAHAIPATTAAS